MCFNLRKMGICDIKNPPIVILFTIGGYALLCLHARCIVHPSMSRIIKTVLLRIDLIGKASCPAPPRQFPLLSGRVCVRMECTYPARSSALPKHKGVVGVGRTVKQAKPCVIALIARSQTAISFASFITPSSALHKNKSHNATVRVSLQK